MRQAPHQPRANQLWVLLHVFKEAAIRAQYKSAQSTKLAFICWPCSLDVCSSRPSGSPHVRLKGIL